MDEKPSDLRLLFALKIKPNAMNFWLISKKQLQSCKILNLVLYKYLIILSMIETHPLCLLIICVFSSIVNLPFWEEYISGGEKNLCE